MYKSIDGSKGEGGGSIVRLSFAFASLTNKPLLVKNIRANRSKPGLRTQHLVGIKTLHSIFGGELSNADVGSIEVSYKPGETNENKNEYVISINTAGSIALVIQVLRLSLAKTDFPIKLIFQGGATYGLGAPSIDYIKQVTEPTLQLWGYKSEIQIKKHGFYPKGGAAVEVIIYPKKNIPKDEMIRRLVKCKRIESINGLSISAKGLERAKVAERQKDSAIQTLKASFPNIEIDIACKYVSSLSPGSGLTLWTNQEGKMTPPIGQSVIGKKGLPAEKVGKTAALRLINSYNSFAVIDEYLSDQIVSYGALNAPFSFSTPEITSHTKTNMALIEEFISVRFKVESKDQKKIIHVDPI
ncbi:MAG: RNA 3'-terminal phosphate cyclase [Candidatus Heimdallarchaeota archaeon LC_3]|nr:MAG: RNA 3'-terminal phosphate cyclase [Candidatus Heimdallarchaeota archaeon LC_3]